MLLTASWPAPLLLLVLSSTAHASWWPFQPKRFRGNSLIDAGSRGLNSGDRVVAFGDFNGDQFLDLLTLDDDRQTLTTHLWDHEAFTFKQSSIIKHTQDVVNVVPGDFTHSGKLDLLVMSQGRSSGTLDLSLYAGLASGGFDSTPIALQSSTTAQPIPVDLDGDMKIDLLGSTADTSSSLKAWQNIWNASDPASALFEIIDPPFKGKTCTLADPHSNAVVDLNGDCLADVFLVCDDGRGSKSYQIWVNNKDEGFSLSQEGDLPHGTQAITFGDMDRDGTIDMVFTTCFSVSSDGIGNDCVLNIAFNQQLPLCGSSSDSGLKNGENVCRPPDDLCKADPAFKFDLSDINRATLRLPFSSLFPHTVSILVQDTTSSPPLPIPIKLGDVNLDGFPDLLIITAVGNEHTPKLILSVPCGSGVIGCSINGPSPRGWQVATEDVASLDSVKDARSVSFIDMDEDGTLDLLIQRTGVQGAGKFLFVQNNFYYDAFFLKAIVLNGACGNGWCYGPNGTEKYHPFGVSYSGASYKYTVLDTSGRRSAAQVGQLPQTGYHSLQTPYSFFGLGRTNNYIENLFVGATLHTRQHYINMEGVVPNSKVVILPSAREGETWKRELFLRPGAWIPWVTLTVVIGTFLLAVIVFVLHLNEKREDELERRRVSHHINFDAL